MSVKIISLLFLSCFILVFMSAGVFAGELSISLHAEISGLKDDFSAQTNINAQNAFDGYDNPITPLPDNYISLYSRICAGNSFECRLALDSWKQSSNPRILQLEYKTSTPAPSGDLVLTWDFANSEQFEVILVDYGTDSTRNNEVQRVDMGSANSYTVTSSSDSRYFNLEVENRTIIINPGDTTAPGPVTNLRSINRTSSSITWAWNNPGDADFGAAMLYLNNANKVNTTSSQYTFSQLSSGTSYTLKVHTKDMTGNVNTQDVSDSVSTLSSSGGGTGGTTGGSAGGTGGAGGASGAGGATGAGATPGSGFSNIFGRPSTGDVGDGEEDDTVFVKSGDDALSNLLGRIGLTYGLLGVALVLLIAIIVIVIRIVRNNSKKTPPHLKKVVKAKSRKK